MYDVGMVMISGGRGRPNLFQHRMGDVFGRQFGGSPSLGQTGVGTYTQVKNDIAQWDALAARLKRIANQAVREQLAQRFGLTNPSDKDKGQYMRDRSAYHVAQADSSSPPNYSIFAPDTPGPAKNDARDLESFIAEAQSAIKSAEDQFGLLTGPQTISVATTPGWVVPVVVGVGVLALLGITGIVKF